MKPYIITSTVAMCIASASYAGNPEPIIIAEEPPLAASVTDWSGYYAGGSYDFTTSEMYTI